MPKKTIDIETDTIKIKFACTQCDHMLTLDIEQIMHTGRPYCPKCLEANGYKDFVKLEMEYFIKATAQEK